MTYNEYYKGLCDLLRSVDWAKYVIHVASCESHRCRRYQMTLWYHDQKRFRFFQSAITLLNHGVIVEGRK